MKKFPLILAAVMSLTLLAGCTSNAEPPQAYSYQNEPPIANHIYAPTLDEGMSVDGEREEVYGDAVFRLWHQNRVNSSIYMDVWMYYGEEGVYTYLNVTDNCVYFNSARAVYYNSSIELFLHDASETRISNRTCQWRVTATNVVAKLCGVQSAGTYWGSYFDGISAAKIDGELNTNTCKGFAVETFTPWYELGVEDPSTAAVMMHCAYNAVTDNNETSKARVRTCSAEGYQASPYTWIETARNEENRIVRVMNEGTFFGSPDDIYFTQSMFDLSLDDGTAEAKTVIDRANSYGYAYVNQPETAENFYFECNVDRIDAGANGPKIGLLVQFASQSYALFASRSGNIGIVRARADGNVSTWEWGDFRTTSIRFSNTASSKLAVYRNGTELYFFVNDTLCMTTEAEPTCSPKDGSINDYLLFPIEAEDSCYLGCVSWSSTGEISQYSLVTGTEADEKFNSKIG